MKKTGIFFDFDGTLFYGTTDINFQVINLTLADMGRPPITREEAAVLLRRAAAYLGRETATSSNLAECNDYDSISPWADDSLYWATEIRLIDWAPGGLMAPGETISPGEFSGILERFA